jgi:hypothetical protein
VVAINGTKSTTISKQLVKIHAVSSSVDVMNFLRKKGLLPVPPVSKRKTKQERFANMKGVPTSQKRMSIVGNISVTYSEIKR